LPFGEYSHSGLIFAFWRVIPAFKLEWDYSPKGKTLNWSGITPQKVKIKLELDYFPKSKI
jgi:hypothetical protein